MKEYKCINPVLGKKLGLYEFGKLDQEEEIEFEAHLLECDSCYKDFSEMGLSVISIKQLYEQGDLNEMGDLIINILHPVRQKSLFTKSSDQLILAAKTRDSLSNYKIIGEFQSKDNKILMRVLKNSATEEISCFILSEDPDLYQNVVVEIQGYEQKFISNNQGVIFIGKIPDIDFAESKILIKTPLASFNLSMQEKESFEDKPVQIIPLENQNMDRIILMFSQGEKCKILQIKIDRIQACEKQSLHVVVQKENGEMLHSKFKDGVATFESLENEKKLTISIY